MDISYIISDRFRYDLLIADDVGRSIADDYGWHVVRLSDAHSSSADVLIFDNRILEDELELVSAILKSKRKLYILRIVDPALEVADNWWYDYCLSQIDQTNVHFITPYHPCDIIGTIWSRALSSRILFAPYVYRIERELPLNHATRSKTLIVSGTLHPAAYPLRHAMYKAAKLPPLSFYADILPHPGYPDIGQTLRHNHVGNRYVDRLSSYRFGTICSSKWRVEYLKYREFAYAGLAPIGDMPATLIDCPRDAYLPWRRNTVALTQSLRNVEESQAVATRYRAFMRQARGMEKMRISVQKRIAALA